MIRLNSAPIVALPFRHADTASNQLVMIGDFNGRYHMVRRRIDDENADDIAACPMVLSSASLALLQQFQPTLQHVRLLDVDAASVFQYRAAIDDNRERVLFRKLSAAVSVDDEEDVLLSDTSLDKACEVRVRDLRRLVTREWLNDEIINALLAIFVRDNSIEPIDAFSSLIEPKVQQLVSSPESRNNKPLATRYYSFRGQTFQYLLENNVVRYCVVIDVLMPFFTANFNSLACTCSLVIVLY